ncbi:hypothetical protein [Bradyrhizobium sp. USDA 3650]
MILVARKVVEELAERGKKLAESPAIIAGKKMPGYHLYEQALSAQINFREIEEVPATPPVRKK